MTRLVIALLAAVLPLAAQTSSLQGVVTDPQGSAVPAAIVTITNTDTSAARTAGSERDCIGRHGELGGACSGRGQKLFNPSTGAAR